MKFVWFYGFAGGCGCGIIVENGVRYVKEMEGLSRGDCDCFVILGELELGASEHPCLPSCLLPCLLALVFQKREAAADARLWYWSCRCASLDSLFLQAFSSLRGLEANSCILTFVLYGVQSQLTMLYNCLLTVTRELHVGNRPFLEESFISESSV